MVAPTFRFPYMQLILAALPPSNRALGFIFTERLTWSAKTFSEKHNVLQSLYPRKLVINYTGMRSSIHLRWYVPQNMPKSLFKDGGERSIVSDCNRE